MERVSPVPGIHREPCVDRSTTGGISMELYRCGTWRFGLCARQGPGASPPGGLDLFRVAGAGHEKSQTGVSGSSEAAPRNRAAVYFR